MKKLFPITLIITLLFLFAIAIDLSPFLRGPAPYFPDWRWPYQLPMFSWKLLMPFITGAIALQTFDFFLHKKIFKLRYFFTASIVSIFAFQLSLLFASNQGVFVLIHRMINPLISGYFTTATMINTIPEFLSSFNTSFASYPMYARFHPPLDVLFYFFINQISLLLTPFLPFISKVSPGHVDVLFIWSSLFEYEKVGAIIGAVMTMLLSLAGSIPVFYATQRLYDKSTALRASCLYLLVPSLLLFAPLPDVIYPGIVASSFYLFTLGLTGKKLYWYFLSGVIFAAASLFTLTCIPLLGLLVIFYLLHQKTDVKRVLSDGSLFLIGFLLPLIFLQLFFHMDIFSITQKMLHFHHLAQSGRQYSTWLLFNLYDFFLFLGIPISILFFNQCKQLVKIRSIKKVREHALLTSFVVLIICIDLAGTVLGEAGRIWLPYIVFPVIITANIQGNWSQKNTILLLGLLVLQIIVFQLFLVTLW